MDKTTVKKGTKKRWVKKKAKGQRKILRRVLEWAFFLLVGVCYVVMFKLGGCTIGHLPSGLWWYIVIATIIAVIAWASLKKNLKGNIMLYASIGFFYGMMIFILIMALILGTNFLFPRSEPYRVMAVVNGKKMERHFRGPTSYEINLRFNNGLCFPWGGGFKEFEKYQEFDTCVVTIYKGLWGFNVIQDIELTGPAKRHNDPSSSTISLFGLDEHRHRAFYRRIIQALNHDKRMMLYGMPLSIHRITGADMNDESRVGLLKFATIEDISKGKRIFIECIWKIGDGYKKGKQRITYWYEWREDQLYAVDSLQWNTDEVF